MTRWMQIALTLGGIVAAIAVAWGTMYTRVSAAEVTIERHDSEIRRLDRTMDRSIWNTWAICKHVGATDCEKPGDPRSR